jgi:hypothetical protein
MDTIAQRFGSFLQEFSQGFIKGRIFFNFADTFFQVVHNTGNMEFPFELLRRELLLDLSATESHV